MIPAHDHAPDLVGTRIGGCHLTRRIARGGSADVYEGRTGRADPERVAVKVGRSADAATTRRFGRERRMLERLAGPGVVRFRDAGALDDGRPVLVSAYVDGRHLDDHGHGLSVDGVLAIVERIATIVQQAHAAGICHGDLKPANILVDAGNSPVVLDFGSACADLDRERTTTGAMPLTPYYASPETMGGAPPTARSDVFSLGVVLRDLLTDASDFQVASRRLRRHCAHLVAKSTNADADERHVDAGDLARDLARVRAGRSPAVGRRLQRLWRRHRGLLLTGVACVAVLAGATMAAIDGASRARVSRSEALSVSEFLVRLLDQAGPDAHGPDVTLSDAWEFAEPMIPKTFAGKPDAEARVRMAYGRACARGGKLVQAVAHLERAIVLLGMDRATNLRSIEWCERLLARCRAGS